ncbi:hypothetical protein Tco_0852063 [Tanacetum coccineum]
MCPVSVSTATNGVIRFCLPANMKKFLSQEMKEKQDHLAYGITRRFILLIYKITDAKIDVGSYQNLNWFQSLLSQLEIHGAGVSTEDANQKFLRSLPSAWSQVSLIIRTKPGVDSLSFDELTNEVSTPYGASSSSGHNPQREGSSSYTDELMYSFFANQSSGLQLDHEDLEQVESCNLMPRNRSKGNQDSRRRDAWNTRNKAKDNERRSGKQEEPKALVTLDGDGVDWTSHSENEQENYALMAYSNSGSDTKEPKRACEETLESMPEPVVIEPKVVSQPKVWSDAPIIEEYESDSDDDCVTTTTKNRTTNCDFHEKRMAKQAELNKRMCKGTGQRENRPVWNNVQRVNHQNQFVPTAVLTRTGRIQVNTARASSTNNVNTARHNFNSQAVPTNATMKVNTVKPIVNNDYPQRALKNEGIDYDEMSSMGKLTFFLGLQVKQKEKEKGVELKNVEDIERPRPTSTRSVLTLKPLPKIDPKAKGKGMIEEEDESANEIRDERLIKDLNKKAAGIKKAGSIKEESKEEEGTKKRKLSTRKKMKSRKRRFRQDTSEDDETNRVHTLMTETGLVIHTLFEKKYHLRKKVLLQMLELKLESEEDSSMALELIRFVKKLIVELEPENSDGDEKGYQLNLLQVKSWLVQDQTIPGKDKSNLLIADSLLKNYMVINAPCYGNEALTSPKANELAIPEQTATGKGTSNPLMAGSLPKTIKPT